MIRFEGGPVLVWQGAVIVAIVVAVVAWVLIG